MPKLSRSRLEKLLANGLKLDDPVFKLESNGDRINGSVISRTFEGKRDLARQDMIWGVLDRELGADAVRKVGMILAYTPAEWYIDDEPTQMTTAKARR
jgi:acid stress-induced BolA-like protein IbaG/YrbA